MNAVANVEAAGGRVDGVVNAVDNVETDGGGVDGVVNAVEDVVVAAEYAGVSAGGDIVVSVVVDDGVAGVGDDGVGVAVVGVTAGAVVDDVVD